MVTPLARIRLVSNRSDAGEETGLIHAQRRGITKLWSLLLLGCTVSAWSTRARWARARSPRGRRDRDCVSQPCGFDISSACNMDKKPQWRKTSEEQHRRERKVRRNEERQSIQIKGRQSHNKESNRTRLRKCSGSCGRPCSCALDSLWDSLWLPSPHPTWRRLSPLFVLPTLRRSGSGNQTNRESTSSDNDIVHIVLHLTILRRSERAPRTPTRRV